MENNCHIISIFNSTWHQLYKLKKIHFSIKQMT
uniref:Uncharacterized protein n=1 Tax=Rhizophora mucronata TaxID=61149 RepID=A0A2P2MD65_RHIMU